MPLAEAQAAFAEAGLMLALDPPLGPSSAATIGGIVAAGDSGPLRHRFGGPRDLVLGMTAVLGDGTVIRSGGTVIKNVAGYDLAKLFAGSFGTLGLIAAVAVRLHPLPVDRRTVVASTDDAAALAAAAGALAHAPLELDALDVSWADGRGVGAGRRVGCGRRSAGLGCRGPGPPPRARDRRGRRGVVGATGRPALGRGADREGVGGPLGPAPA